MAKEPISNEVLLHLENQKLESENAALRSELAEARKDSERLEYLTRNVDHQETARDWFGKKRPGLIAWVFHLPLAGNAQTLRQAIDAARERDDG